jgi:hypothetical protein
VPRKRAKSVVEARETASTPEVAPQATPPQFVLGFKDLADKLGAAAGSPLVNEFYAALQPTTHGVMFHHPEIGTHFVPWPGVVPIQPPAPEPPSLIVPENPPAWTREQILAAVAEQARLKGLPPRLPLACVIAESDLNQYAERWGTLTAAAKTAIVSKDRAALERVLADLKVVGADKDISFGLAQLNVAFLAGYAYDPDALLLLRAKHFDPGITLPIMGQRLREALNAVVLPPNLATDAQVLEALYRYNWPAGNGKPFTPTHASNYQRGLEAAKQLLAVPAGEPWSTILKTGRLQIGKRYAGPIIGEPDSYRWGNPGFDCSSFVTYCYRAAGHPLSYPHAYTDNIFGLTVTVSATDARPGDMVFFEYDDSQAARFPHMGLLAPGGQLLDCSINLGVKERAMPNLGTRHLRRLKGL